MNVLAGHAPHCSRRCQAKDGTDQCERAVDHGGVHTIYDEFGEEITRCWPNRAPVLGADCRDEKHAACIGDAWDVLRDEATPCTCFCHHVELSVVEQGYVETLSEILGEEITVTDRGTILLTEVQVKQVMHRFAIKPNDDFEVNGSTWCGIPIEEVKS
ncbi:hypothetical protein [Microbacterium sp. NPDC089696]|uniref:hypothetical protein n=1 Tax=Microbacterium sp. NPDC089696 TaxID=3364199 RepID=UPI00381015B4